MAYIDREKAIAYIEEQYRLFRNEEDKQAIVEGCVEALKFTPTADVVEMKYGEWIWNTEDKYKCSHCHYTTRVDEVMGLPQYKYCPNCGAKMSSDYESSKNEC